jgi:hypothetical protein
MGRRVGRLLITATAAAAILAATGCEYGGRTDVGQIACEVGLLGEYVFVSSPHGNVVCSHISASRENCRYLFSIDGRLTDNLGACDMGNTVHWWTSYGTL